MLSFFKPLVEKIIRLLQDQIRRVDKEAPGNKINVRGTMWYHL